MATFRTVSLAMMLLVPGGCFFGITNGEIEEGPTLGATYEVGGYARLPGQHVRIEVLSPADQDPYDPASTWEQVGEEIEVTNIANKGMYFWSTSLTIVPSAAESDRWTDGGLARIRATAVEDDLPLVIFDDMQCVIDNLSGSALDIAQACESPDSPVLTLVNTSVVPAPRPAHDESEPRFLRIKSNSALDADNYYVSIDAPPNFEDFLDLYGFDGSDEVQAQYYNAADLGFGRDMHCRTVSPCDDGQVCEGSSGALCDTVLRTACYVTNYGNENDTQLQALELLQDPFDAGATVAMVKIHHAMTAADCIAPVTADPPAYDDVQFYVYDTGASPGAPGLATLRPTVQLDAANGQQAVPGLCLNCHGGNSFATRTGLTVAGARFLPFDVDSFGYLDNVHKAEEQDDFRRLNEMVLDTELEGEPDDTAWPSPIAELILGWYGGLDAADTAMVRDPAAVYDNSFVPDNWLGDERLYREVVAPHCRLCHAAFVEHASTWSAADSVLFFPNLVSRVCNANDMPHSRRTFENFWTSAARVALVNEVGFDGDCAPPDCNGNGTYNTVTETCDCDPGHSGFECQL